MEWVAGATVQSNNTSCVSLNALQLQIYNLQKLVSSITGNENIPLFTEQMLFQRITKMLMYSSTGWQLFQSIAGNDIYPWN